MIAQQLGQNLRAQQLVNRTHGPAADTAAVITLAAIAGVRHIIPNIDASYSETPTGGALTVTSDGTTIYAVAIVGTEKKVDLPIIGGIGEAVVITLAAGGGTAVGKVNALTTEMP